MFCTQIKKQLMDVIGPVARLALDEQKLCITGDSMLHTVKRSKRNQRVHLDDIMFYLIVLVSRRDANRRVPLHLRLHKRACCGDSSTFCC
jgi:hypothetical protein